MGESFISPVLAPFSVDKGAGASYDCQEDYVCALRLHSCLLGNQGSHFIFMPELLCDLRKFTSLSSPHFVSRLRHQGGLLMNLGAHICPQEHCPASSSGDQHWMEDVPNVQKKAVTLELYVVWISMDAEEKWS